MKSRPGAGDVVRQSVAAGSGDVEQQQDLGLQGIGILELVHENVREALLEAAARQGRFRR